MGLDYPELLAELSELRNGLNSLSIKVNDCVTLEPWNRRVISALLIATGRHYDYLKIGAQIGQIEMICWAARNILELRVFVKFVIQLKENAKRFSDDAINDTQDWTNAAIGLIKHHPKFPPFAERAKEIQANLQAVREKSDLLNTDKYLQAGKLAKTVDLESEFYSINQVLSKLVHPTAFSIMPAVREEYPKQFIDTSIHLGILQMYELLALFQNYLNSIGVDTSELNLRRQHPI